ncbi:MAG: response regulator [Chitinophagaceae bacterium]
MRPIYILLVEDNEGDILLTTEAFEEGKIANKIRVVKDGKEAINFLTKASQQADMDLPGLILLDINLPKMNGHEVLHHLKMTDELIQIPVIMLTTSSTEKDIFNSYKNAADFYITKPVEITDLINAVTRIGCFRINIEKHTGLEMISND